jgi:hypothetical protein
MGWQDNPFGIWGIFFHIVDEGWSWKGEVERGTSDYVQATHAKATGNRAYVDPRDGWSSGWRDWPREEWPYQGYGNGRRP